MMEEFDDEEPHPVGELSQCNTCKRMFFPKVLVKHAKICEKSASKRRRVFDSSRQRAAGTDIPTLKPLKPKAEPPKKPSNWRKKHEDFLAAIKASKASMKAMKEGGPLPPPPPPMYDPDLIQCPYCQRRFNESSAQGHIKFCRDQASRMGNKNKLGEVKKMPARAQYKPPPLVKKVNSAASTIPSASSRLPARSGLAQPTGVPSSKASSATSTRTNTSGITSPASAMGMKNRVAGSGYGIVRNTTTGRGQLNKKKLEDTCIRRDDMDGSNDVGNGEIKNKFCHSCGSMYPIKSAKFCCECGMRRLCI
ncbi:zinc finger C2HC domain-containing protein 1A isoform X2 [Vanacampus margaritifer]